MRATEILSEVAASDLYPKTFEQFRAKYAPMAGRTDLYVNFNDDVGDTVNKSFSPKPTHRDPSGVYAYPLDYVLNHPADIQYGQQARYLRVIQDTSSNKLVLPTLTKERALDLLGRMGIENPQKRMSAMQASVTRSVNSGKGIPLGGNVAAKMFFWIMQDAYGKGVLSNAEQNALLRKAGIDALEDTARTEAEATINHHEPEQIIFLKRSAFRVIDAFELRAGKAKFDDPTSLDKADRTENLRRLPALVATAIGDRIVSTNTTGERSGEQTYYTAAKRKIVVQLSKVYSWDKKHRELGDASMETIRVAIMGPGFKTVKGQYDHQTTFADVAKDMAAKFEQRQEGPGAEYDREAEHAPDVRFTIETLAKIAAKLKVPFDTNMSPQVAYAIYKSVSVLQEDFFGSAKSKSAFVEGKVVPTIEKLWQKSKRRPPQVDQLLGIYRAVAAKKIPGLSYVFKLIPIQRGDYRYANSVAELLKLDTKRTDSAGDYRKEFKDGFAIARRGEELVFEIGENMHSVAKITNNKLNDFSKAKRDETVYLKHAADIASYLNSQHFYVEGYATWLPEHWGVVYDAAEEEWKTLDEGADKLGTYGDVTIWKLPDPKPDADKQHWYVAANVKGNTDWSDLGPGAVGMNDIWNEMVYLFIVNDQNEITSMSGELKEWLQWADAKKKDPTHWRGEGDMPRWSNAPGRREKEALAAVFKSGFDPLKFMRDQNYGFGEFMGDDEIGVFGMVRNRDNMQVGANWAEVLDPVGEVDGAEVFRVRRKDSIYGSRRHYVVKRDGKPLVLFTTSLDPTYGKDDVAISSIPEDMPVENRKVARALIKQLGLKVPAKFSHTLSVR